MLKQIVMLQSFEMGIIDCLDDVFDFGFESQGGCVVFKLVMWEFNFVIKFKSKLIYVLLLEDFVICDYICQLDFKFFGLIECIEVLWFYLEFLMENQEWDVDMIELIVYRFCWCLFVLFKKEFVLCLIYMYWYDWNVLFKCVVFIGCWIIVMIVLDLIYQCVKLLFFSICGWKWKMIFWLGVWFFCIGFGCGMECRIFWIILMWVLYLLFVLIMFQ